MLQTTTRISLVAGGRYFLEDFEKDLNSPIPFDGTQGPYCIITGEALVYRMEGKKLVDNGTKTKVAVRASCINHQIPNGVYVSEEFESIVYLVRSEN